MTDYTLLIAKLNHYISHNDDDFVKTFIACADALEAQARRIADLEERAALIDEHLSQAIGNLKKRDARIAALEAALKPFAAAADLADDLALPNRFLVRGEYLRAARAAYLGEKE